MQFWPEIQPNCTFCNFCISLSFYLFFLFILTFLELFQLYYWIWEKKLLAKTFFCYHWLNWLVPLNSLCKKTEILLPFSILECHAQNNPELLSIYAESTLTILFGIWCDPLILHTGDSGENSLVCSICNVLKKLFWVLVRVGLLLNTWRNLSLCITIGLKIKSFARAYVKLKLSVKEKFVAYGTMSKILTTLTSPFSMECFLIQNLNILLKECIFPNVLAINVFFHNLTCWRYNIFSVVYGTLNL